MLRVGEQILIFNPLNYFFFAIMPSKLSNQISIKLREDFFYSKIIESMICQRVFNEIHVEKKLIL